MADKSFSHDSRVIKVSEELGLVFGWAIVCKENGKEYFDVQGDHIPEESMLKAATDFMVNSRMAKEMHSGDSVGSVLFAWPMTKEIGDKLNVLTDTTGLLIAMKPDSPDTLEKFKNGEFTGFSIGGSRITDEEVDDG